MRERLTSGPSLRERADRACLALFDAIEKMWLPDEYQSPYGVSVTKPTRPNVKLAGMRDTSDPAHDARSLRLRTRKGFVFGIGGSGYTAIVESDRPGRYTVRTAVHDIERFNGFQVSKYDDVPLPDPAKLKPHELRDFMTNWSADARGGVTSGELSYVDYAPAEGAIGLANDFARSLGRSVAFARLGPIATMVLGDAAQA